MQHKFPTDDGGSGQDDGGRSDSFQPASTSPADPGPSPAFGDLGAVGLSPVAAQAGTGGTSGSSLPAVTGGASAFVINVVYDSSVNNAPSGFTAGIQAAVTYLESVITAPVTVNIDVGYGEIAGQSLDANALGESETFFNSYSYASIKSALANVAPTAASNLPSSAPGQMWLATAQAKALGLAAASSSVDGFASFSSSLPFAYDPNNRAVGGEYDFIGVVEHEFTEVMGRVDLFGATLSNGVQNFPNSYSLLDLMHYTSPGVHTYTGTNTNYFSTNNGANNLDNFNTNPNGDSGDWAGSAGNDSFLAFSGSGVANTMSQSDIAEMNALGYAIPPPTGIAVNPSTAEALQGGGAVVLLASTPTITDSKSGTIANATIKIANGSGVAVAGDKLFVAGVQSGTVSGVAVAWNATTNTLTLTGSASLATYQTLLGEVTYQDTGTDASSGAHPVRTVTWSVNDGTQTLTTTSQAIVDRSPTANNATAFAVAGKTLTVAAGSGVLSGDSDLDGDALSVTSVNGVAANVGTSIAGSDGRLTLNANGSYSYAANAGVAAGSVDTFNYTVGDGNGGSAAATLKITIDNALATAPLAILTPSGKATPSTWMLPGSGGNGSLTFALAQVASHGTAVVNANGTFTYTPMAGYSGSDSFQYKVTDGLGETSLNVVSVGIGAGYSIAQSLQLSASQSQYLTQTPSTAGNQETWTWSGWVNLNSLTTTDLFETVVTGGGWSALRFNQGQLEFYDYNGSSYNSYLLTNQTFNPNTWYQVALVYDSTQAVATNRLELFVNGQQITSLASLTDPSQDLAGVTGSAAPRALGFDAKTPNSPKYITGNLADVQFIEGQALSPSALGQLVNGVWEPIAYTGSYGTGSYHLTFASGSGADSSGSGNNFTLVNGPSVSSAAPPGSGAQVALTLDNGVAFNGGSIDAIAGATVHLTGGFANDADLVTASTGGTSITASWNATSETLTLTGTDTAAHYQAVLDNLVFSSGAADPSNGGANPTRTATWQVTDATNSQLSAAQSETIDISPAYAPSGGGGQLVFSDTTSQVADSIVISNGSSAELVFSAAPVSFIGATGTLQLDHSAQFTGQISGFAGRDQIDLRDIVFSPQTALGYAASPDNTGGKLIASDGGRTADLALIGNFAAPQFAAFSDGHGGTLVTMAQANSTDQTPLVTPQART
jgi:hypothetical protein